MMIRLSGSMLFASARVGALTGALLFASLGPLVGTLMLPINAQAQTPAPDNPPAGARLLAAGCVSCHGSEGQPPAGGLPLAGLKEAFFISRMQEFQSGQRPATVMQQIAKGYGEPQIAILAKYFAAQSRAGDPP